MQNNPATELSHSSIIKEIQRYQSIYFKSPWDEDYLNTLIRSPLTTLDVSRETFALRGYCLCQQLAPDMAEILQLLVSPADRKQGIATLLLKKTAQACRIQGIAILHLEASRSSTAAIELYTKLGATITGTRPNYYSGTTGDAATALNLTWIL